MKRKIKENKEFAKWVRDWIPLIQQNRAWVEHTPPEKTVGANGQEYSEGAHLFGPKPRAASGRYVA
jgi:hypothetical protein